MKGMIEVCFPSLSGGKEGASESGTDSSAAIRSWLGESPVLNHFSRFSPISRGVRVGEYLELLRQEHMLKRLSPHWSSFSAARVTIRLHEDWIEHVQHAQSVVRSLACSFEPAKNERASSLMSTVCEVVIPAKRVSRIHKRSDILHSPLVTISDLFSPTPCRDWALCEAYSSLAKQHNILGLEFACRSYENERELLRSQLKVTSLLKPKFIRILQNPSSSIRLFSSTSPNERRQTKSLSLALEAFAALQYEPVVLSPYSIVLSAQPELDWKQLGIPNKVLGLGVAAKSRRTDGAGRTVYSRNACAVSEYRRLIQGMWRKRSTVQKAHAIPYLNNAIENGFVDGDGLCYDSILQRFGFDLEREHPGLSSVLKDAGLIEQSAEKFVLTKKANSDPHQVVRNFFLGEQDLRLQ